MGLTCNIISLVKSNEPEEVIHGYMYCSVSDSTLMSAMPVHSAKCQRHS